MCVCFYESGALGAASMVSVALLGSLAGWKVINSAKRQVSPDIAKEMDGLVTGGLVLILDLLAYMSQHLSWSSIVVAGPIVGAYWMSCRERRETLARLQIAILAGSVGLVVLRMLT
jgi:hypothetical protein